MTQSLPRHDITGLNTNEYIHIRNDLIWHGGIGTTNRRLKGPGTHKQTRIQTQTGSQALACRPGRQGEAERERGKGERERGKGGRREERERDAVRGLPWYSFP